MDMALAHLFSRGIRRIIKGARHHDNPEAVIDAVDDVLRALHSEAKS